MDVRNGEQMQKRLQEFGGCAFIVMLGACGGGYTTSPGVGAVATVSVTAPSTSDVVGGTMQLRAAAADANGMAVSGLPVTWTSSNASVASVNTSGLVTGIAPGGATITAMISSVPGTKALTVAAVPASATVQATTALTFDPAQVDITAGGSVTWAFAATIHHVTFTTTATGTPANIGDQSTASVPRTFTTAGSFPYRCTLPQGMNGTVAVHSHQSTKPP